MDINNNVFEEKVKIKLEIRKKNNKLMFDKLSRKNVNFIGNFENLLITEPSFKHIESLNNSIISNNPNEIYNTLYIELKSTYFAIENLFLNKTVLNFDIMKKHFKVIVNFYITISYYNKESNILAKSNLISFVYVIFTNIISNKNCISNENMNLNITNQNSLKNIKEIDDLIYENIEFFNMVIFDLIKASEKNSNENENSLLIVNILELISLLTMNNSLFVEILLNFDDIICNSISKNEMILVNFNDSNVLQVTNNLQINSTFNKSFNFMFISALKFLLSSSEYYQIIDCIVCILDYIYKRINIFALKIINSNTNKPLLMTKSEDEFPKYYLLRNISKENKENENLLIYDLNKNNFNDCKDNDIDMYLFNYTHLFSNLTIKFYEIVNEFATNLFILDNNKNNNLGNNSTNDNDMNEIISNSNNLKRNRNFISSKSEFLIENFIICTYDFLLLSQNVNILIETLNINGVYNTYNYSQNNEYIYNEMIRYCVFQSIEMFNKWYFLYFSLNKSNSISNSNIEQNDNLCNEINIQNLTKYNCLLIQFLEFWKNLSFNSYFETIFIKDCNIYNFNDSIYNFFFEILARFQANSDFILICKNTISCLKNISYIIVNIFQEDGRIDNIVSFFSKNDVLGKFSSILKFCIVKQDKIYDDILLELICLSSIVYELYGYIGINLDSNSSFCEKTIRLQVKNFTSLLRLNKNLDIIKSSIIMLEKCFDVIIKTNHNFCFELFDSNVVEVLINKLSFKSLNLETLILLHKILFNNSNKNISSLNKQFLLDYIENLEQSNNEKLRQVSLRIYESLTSKSNI